MRLSGESREFDSLVTARPSRDVKPAPKREETCRTTKENENYNSQATSRAVSAHFRIARPFHFKSRAGFAPSTELDNEGGGVKTNGNAREYGMANGSAPGAKGGATTQANDARRCRHRRELRGGWKWLCGRDWEGGCGGGGGGGGRDGGGHGRW